MVAVRFWLFREIAILLCGQFLFFTVLYHWRCCDLWAFAAVCLIRWPCPLCNLFKWIHPNLFGRRCKTLDFCEFRKIKPRFKHLWLGEVYLVQKWIIKNCRRRFPIHLPSAPQIINRYAKCRHLKYATGHIASFILALIKLVLWQHEILKLICSVDGPCVLSWVRVCLKAGSFVLESLYCLNVKFAALV